MTNNVSKNTKTPKMTKAKALKLKTYPVPDVIQEFASIFTKNSHQLYIVGGAVRDFFLCRPISDYDFCTDATPEQVIEMFRSVIPTGIKHGTVTVRFRGNSFEVTTFRTEGPYSDQRHPDNITYVSDLADDLSRRDFTINAIAVNCSNGQIIDLYQGKNDIQVGIVRAIGDPIQRFSEDALRMMRFARFCAELDMKADKDTFDAAKKLSSNITKVSAERICEELFKILSSDNPYSGLVILINTGILETIIPEFKVQADSKLKSKLGYDCFNTMISSYLMPDLSKSDLTTKLAFLFHDIGLPTTIKNKNPSQKGTDYASANIARIILKRLKCSNQLIDDVCKLILYHNTYVTREWSNGQIKRFFNELGWDNVPRLIPIHECIAMPVFLMGAKTPFTMYEKDAYDKFINDPKSLKDLAVNGDDLVAAGIPRNKELGAILDLLLDVVLEHPSLNEKPFLTQLAIRYRNMSKDSDEPLF